MRAKAPPELEPIPMFGELYPNIENGHFRVKVGSVWLHCISTRSRGWEHVSVVPRDKFGEAIVRTPSWREMCRIKELFWPDDEAVIQVHPPKSQHVNIMDTCLHLWRPIDGVFPLPEKYLVY